MTLHLGMLGKLQILESSPRFTGRELGTAQAKLVFKRIKCPEKFIPQGCWSLSGVTGGFSGILLHHDKTFQIYME